MKYNIKTLSCGLRVIHLPSPSPVVYCGYQIAAGTRHELPGEEGLAHFCEHMTFKGTRRRSALQIINALEGVGGELNAFTTKEDTVYYAAVMNHHLSDAVDVLTDIVFNSQYPQAEIDKEVEVICDEIESYNDSPAELIYDEFESLVFGHHPLGHNILGQAAQLRGYTTADALRFTARCYRPAYAVFFAYGDLDFRQLVARLERLTKSIGAAKTMNAEKPGTATDSAFPAATTQTRDLGTHQAHVMTGTRAYSIHHSSRMALYLLNNIMGGPGMNSRLNLSLREKHGLVYTVESSMVNYSDTGIWSIYFGCDPKDVGRCRQLIRRELNTMMQKPLSRSRLAAAKRQLKGQIAIACDTREQFALDFGKSFLHYGWERDIDRLFRNIDEVTAEEIQKVAQELFAPEQLTTLIYQ